MKLVDIYNIAKKHSHYKDFYSEIDKIMTNTPTTAKSDNEFRLAHVVGKSKKEEIKITINT